jgi:hypothetical protein
MPQPDAAAVAGIHAAVTAIVFGALVAYVFYAQGKLEDLKEQAFHDLDGVNTLVWSTVSDGWDDSVESEARTSEGRRQLAERFAKLIYESDQDRSSTDRAQRGQDALNILSGISMHYPFPESAVPGAATAKGDWIIPHRLEPAPLLVVRTIDDASAWVEEVRAVLTPVVVALSLHPDDLPAMTNATYMELSARLNLPPAEQAATVPIGLRGVQRMTENIERMVGISVAVAADLRQFESFRRHQPPRWLLLLLVSISAIVFILTVVLPLAQMQIPSIPAVPGAITGLISALFYGTVTLLAVVWVFRLF